ncbi:hypothetical protein [Rhizocola hellebori]|nr:hypothetical protein [Rhizocola hellebori]
MLQRLVAFLVAIAIRRWPERMRETAALEWTAELHTLAVETGVSKPVRAWRQLWFAASLALARPPGGEPVLLGQMRWPGQLALLVSAPLLTMLATLVALVPLQLIPFGYVTLTPTSMALMTTESYLVLAGVATVVGTWLGRRLLRRRDGRPASSAQSAWAALPVIGGLLALDTLARGAGQNWDRAWLAVVGALCLVLALPLLAWGAAALSGRGHHRLALACTAPAAAVLTLATIYVVALAAGRPSASAPGRLLALASQEPMLSFSYSGHGEEPPFDTVLKVLPAFVFATIVVTLAHAIRLVRPLPAAIRAAAPVGLSHASSPGRPGAAKVEPGHDDGAAFGAAQFGPSHADGPGMAAAAQVGPGRGDAQVSAIAGSRWWHRSLLGGAVYSVIAWAVTLTYLTPNIGVQNSWPSRIGDPGQPTLPAEPGGWLEWSSEEGRLWMHELQLSGIICAALCFVAAMAYRSRPVLPALIGSAVLVATNMAVVRWEWTTPRLLPYLAGGGLVLGIAAWWWSSLRLSTRRPWEHRSRRLVITVTVLAAVLVPGSFFPRVYALGKQAPPVLLLVAVGLPAILTMLVVMGVRATSARKWRTPAKLIPLGPALVGIVGVLYYQDGLVAFPSSDNPAFYLFFIFPLALSVPAAVATIAAIRGRMPARRRWWWGLLIVPGLILASYAFSFGSVIATLVIARLILFPMEYGQTYDGIAFVPGSVAIGLLFGFLAAAGLDQTRPAPAPVHTDAQPSPA